MSFKSPYYTSSYLLTWLRRAQQAFPPLLEKPRNFLQATIFFRGSAPATIFVNSSSEPQIKRRSLLSFAALLIFAGLMFESPAFADSNGKFPGKGNYADWKKAAALAEKAMHLNPHNSPLEIELLTKALQIYVFDGKIFYLLGNRYADSHKLALAEENYRKATQLEPEFVDAWYNLGNVQDDLQAKSEAEKSYRTALKIKPDYAAAWYNLGVNLYEQRKYIDSKKAFDSMLKVPHTKKNAENASCYLKQINSTANLKPAGR
ncbi:MAG: tetratricopeptide repeat protein [Candidatus Obscuribacterales bacterium]|nr:tetratricopeptide repeat protein [Candidatus Obscuribacterales bacterium]